MKILSRPILREFWEQPGCEDAKQPLLAWFKEVEKANWRTPADVKQLYRTADIIGNGRMVFNLGGNKYRLVVWVKFTVQLVLIKWIGTHREYDAINVFDVGLNKTPRAAHKRERRKPQ